MSCIDIRCHLHYLVSSPSDFLFNIAVTSTRAQKIESEKISINQDRDTDLVCIGEEDNRVLRLHVERGDFTLDYCARVRLQPHLEDPRQVAEVEFGQLPEEVLPYLNPSRYCESDRLARIALREFGRMAPGHQRVQTICDWTHTQLQYVIGSTDARSSACDVLLQGSGVCRDYAHLAISMCRAMCIPARYVSGYAVGLKPPDFHGFFEAYLDGGWYLFDATRMVPRDKLVRIGSGRDASDVAFATIIGNAMLKNKEVVAHDVNDEDDEGDNNDTNDAVSTA